MSRMPPADWRPWTIAGAPDPDFDAADRVMHHRALTDAQLLTRYTQQFADADADYDAIVRRLGHVWDCPQTAPPTSSASAAHRARARSRDQCAQRPPTTARARRPPGRALARATA